MNEKIREAVKMRDGKPVYVIQVIQENSDEGRDEKFQLSIRNGEVHFESSGYSWNDNSVYCVNNEAHAIAKEMFLDGLRTAVKIKILEIKQLESILSDLGMPNIIRDVIEKQAPRLDVSRSVAGFLEVAL